ncbi:MAG TPA: hypothetical protein VLV78_17325 [Thermoanaerobaculia bacterium]|nr:hypothetical protein [Thermoanaerobaculia bacterium]
MKRPDASLAPVIIGEDGVIRTLTGLRPYRPSGFVARAEWCDGKLLIHNDGHGGCGTVGLASARLPQDHGFEVAIDRRDVPPSATSNIAASATRTRRACGRSSQTKANAGESSTAIEIPLHD